MLLKITNIYRVLPEGHCCQPTWNLVKYHPTKSGIEQVSEKHNTDKIN